MHWIQELIEDELSFHGAMRVLSDHGLVEVEEPSLELVESQGYSIHGCVHSLTVHILNQEWNYDLARVAVKSVALHVPGEQASRPWLTQRRLLQHAARCSYIVLGGLALDDGMEWTVNNLAVLYKTQGKLAEQMYQRALQGYEKAWGTEHTSTLNTVNNLANLYKTQGKLAEQMYQRALQGYETAIGADNITTFIPALNTLWGLGSLFECQADFAKARIMYSKALAGYKKVVRPDHPRCQSLREILQDLDTRTIVEAIKGTKEPASNLLGGLSGLDSKRAPLTLRRYKLFRKLEHQCANGFSSIISANSFLSKAVAN